MRLSVCVTTRNRPTELDTCLRSLHGSTVRPYGIWVSDDSSEPEIRDKNRAIVERYEYATYLVGPQAGVCANRNRAVAAASRTDSELVAFVDDDLCVTPDFIAIALRSYRSLTPEVAQKTILTGMSRDPSGGVTGPARLTFWGHFRPAAVPDTATVHSAVFPRSFFEVERWDENIRFGYEDAELSLRARRRGYAIVQCDGLEVLDHGAGNSTLNVPGIRRLTEREVCVESARLYVGVKRYTQLQPDPLRLVGFVCSYPLQMALFLSRRRSLRALPEIVRRSHLHEAWRTSASTPPANQGVATGPIGAVRS